MCVATTVQLHAADHETDLVGADINRAGDPIGGGAGYTSGPKASDANASVETLEELLSALKRSRPLDVIWIQSDAVVDFTGNRIEIPSGVTLAGDRGLNGSNGPLLTASHSGDEYFILLASGSRISGLRIRGSNPPLDSLDAQTSDPSGYAISCTNATVDNCEISHFRRAGVAMFRTSDRSHIHHNHIHDVAAYPVLLGNGTGDGHLIEANRIEWAWHAIASNGSRGSGYTARHNEFVRVKRPKSFEASGPSPPNWCIDVHSNDGAETRPARNASRRLTVHHNTFLADAAVVVGSGDDLLRTNGLYPKHDIYVGACQGVSTIVEIHHNRFLMHRLSGSKDPSRPFGSAIRIVGLRDNPALPDDPAAPKGVIKAEIHSNQFGTDK